jgi:CMP/dCMP kinase
LAVSEKDELIAIDGESGVGKTTLGRALADHLHAPFWDTGLTFRALAHACELTAQGMPRPDFVERLAASPYVSGRSEARFFDGVSLDDELWAPDISDVLFAVASDEPCRAALLDLHRRIVVPPAIVAGRDIGSTVFPHAALKVVLLASDEVRHARRQGQDTDGVARTPLEPTSLRALWARSRSEDGVLRIDTDEVTAEAVFRIVLDPRAV